MGKTVQVCGFQRHLSEEALKQFIEHLTGQGTVIALEVQLSKGSRMDAKIQFTKAECVVKIISWVNDNTYFVACGMAARELDSEIAPRPKAIWPDLDYITLYFGCQISSNKFSVLWKSESVIAAFGTLKKVRFFLCHDSVEYMLQLSYECIWQVVLYHRGGRRGKLLLVQLFGAPRIYKKLSHDHFKGNPDDQWVRTTDFTASLIGQSSGLCLEFGHGMKLPNFKDKFVYYKERDGALKLERGGPFSRDSFLVPIVHPPKGLELPYKILFKVCSLVQAGCLPGPNLDVNFFRLVNPQIVDITHIEHALEKLYYSRECCYDPVTWLCEQYEKYRTSREQPKSPIVCLDDGLVYIHRVQVTPTKVYFCGPEINVSNRVLRQYREHIDNFLRVSFIDEEWGRMYSTVLSPKICSKDESRTKIYQRIFSTLREGIRIGDKRFEFLAFSSSQLRESSVWMFAPTTNLNADDIRRWMGDFRSIRNVAKYAARLGQSFGSSTETLTVAAHEVESIPDIRVVKDKTTYVFSDGIGKISAGFARRVARKCQVKGYIPSTFQIRYGGYKGVVAIDPNSPVKLSLRPSMLKYISNDTKLDVLTWSKYQPCFLNRQLITLLSTLGVNDRIFMKKQREVVEQLNDILVDRLSAQVALHSMSPGESTQILREMLKCGYKPDAEPFLQMMLQAFRSSKLLDLRTKSRIFIPKARQMMGCLDETGTLDYGQVFVQISGSRRQQFFDDTTTSYGGTCIIKGKVAVAKNPCLHPGDIRVLQAIDVPALHRMLDCVVFPRKGPRPHPNECSGSDLDGDIYFVCWDPDLIPPRQVPPMDYDPPAMTQLDHDVTIEEVEEYFTNYIVNDSLGIIANAHTAFADNLPKMALSEPCLELAKLFSIAVDFPKTGVPAVIPPRLRVTEYPDFMEKSDKPTYESHRVIGKLFQEVKDIAPRNATFKTFTKEVAMKSYDSDMEVNGFRDYIDEAFRYKTEYDYKLGNLMDYYRIKSEAKILSGGMMQKSKTFDQRKDAEAVGVAVRSLRNEARAWFKKGGESDNQYAKASAWYYVTYHPDYWGCYNEGLKRDHYISFPWCVYDKLVKIKQDKSRRAPNVSSVGLEFRRNINLRRKVQVNKFTRTRSDLRLTRRQEAIV